ncbi:MAG TPA: hypothetical protein VJV79_04885, partial [Polyangiaceae bacterium]|nr:hypothetical protein [Polyangiaceae bacterium]
GASGSNMGGKAGTSSSGAGGGSAGGSLGTAGGTSTGPCSNPKDLPAAASGDTGSVGTTAAACYRTKSAFTAVVCSNFQGRTFKVNDVTVVVNNTDGSCTSPAMFAPAIDGWNYFDIGAGMHTYAQLGWFSTN